MAGLNTSYAMAFLPQCTFTDDNTQFVWCMCLSKSHLSLSHVLK